MDLESVKFLFSSPFYQSMTKGKVISIRLKVMMHLILLCVYAIEMMYGCRDRPAQLAHGMALILKSGKFGHILHVLN